MKVRCRSCKRMRNVNANESVACYEKRRPVCVPCGHKERIKTLGGHGPTWAGGARFVDDKGYVVVWDKSKNGYVREHRKVWERYRGPIPKGFVVHHKNENKQDNRIANLECLRKRVHDRHHGYYTLRKFHWNRKEKKVISLEVPY